MKRSKLQTLWLVGLILILSLVAAQCTPSQTDTPAPTEPTQAPAEEPTAAKEEPAATEEVKTEPTKEEVTTEEAAAEEPAAAEGNTLVVGLLTDQSGPLAVYGPQQEAGFMLGLEYATGGTMTVAGRPIEVIVKDNSSDPEKAVSDARELIESEGAEILVGTVSSGATLGVIQVAKENDVILIAEPAASPAITADNFDENTFRTSRTSVQDALAMGAALVQQGSTFVQVAPDYAFGYGSAAGFYNVVKANGGEFVMNDTEDASGSIFIPQDTTDFTPYLTQALDSGAEVLIVTWAGSGFVPLFQQAQELGIFDSMVVATGMGDNQTLAAGYADAVGSVGVSVYHYTLPDNPVNDWLVERHIEEYGSPPDLFTAGGMAAAIMLVEGVEATGGDTSDTALIATFEGMEFEGPKGTYKIRAEDHVALQPMYLVKLNNVTDPDFKFFELLQAFEADETAPPCAVPEELGRCKVAMEEAATEAEPATGEPLVVGLLTDQSGPLAVYGPQQEAGFKLGLEYVTGGTMAVAGRPIEVIVKDNGSDPEKAVSDARELIESEGAEILVGTVSSGATLGVIQVAKENDVILIAEPAASPAITADNFDENTFRTSRTSVQDALAMGAALVQQGSTFVQVAPDYAFGYGSAAGFYNVVKANGGKFVMNDTEDASGSIFIPQDTTDFTPYLTQALDSGAEVLIVTWAGSGFVPLFQQAQELGIFDSMIVATGMGDNQTLAAGYADAVGSVGVSVYHYTLPDNPVNDWLVKRHIEEYGSPPDLFTAGGMAAAIMLVEGVEATGGDTSDTALIATFEGMEFEGPKGTYKIRAEDHVALQPMYLVKLDNVTDPDFKFFELLQAFEADETAPPCAVPEELGRCK